MSNGRNEFDNIFPNSQKGNVSPNIGSESEPWGEMHCKQVNCEEIVKKNSDGSSGVYTESYREPLLPAAISFTITHSLDSRNLNVVILDSSYEKVVPNRVRMPTNNSVIVDFVEPQSGTIIIYKGGF